MTAIQRAVPCQDNGAALPYDARTWQNEANAEISGLWARSSCWLGSVAGTANSITALCSPAETAYARNKAYWLVPAATNTTAVKINIDALGLRDVTDSLGVLLVGGELKAGALYLLVDDGTQLRIVSSAGGSASATNVAPDAILEDQKTAGTNGGDFTGGAWVVRDLTTAVRNVLSGATFGSNRITLLAGTYYARWSCPASACGVHRSRLYNETDGAVVGYGTSEREVVGTADSSRSFGSAVFTIGAAKTLALYHQCATSAANGFGLANGYGPEIYSRLEIWQVGQSAAQINGVPGGALTFLWTFSTTTADADPGDGVLRLNNATVSSATQVFADGKDYYLNDISGVLATIATSTSGIKARLRLEKRGDPTKWATYDVTADTTASGYRKFTLTGANASAAAPFANNDVLVARFDTVGNQGASGPAGDLPKVISRLATPPGAPSAGDRYIVIATATGAWAGHENQEATWSGSAWTFVTPTNDDIRWVSAEDDLYYSTSGIYKPYLYSKNILYPENYGAKGTDGTVEFDDSAALRAFIADGAGKELVLKPGRTYWWKDGSGATAADLMYVQSNCRIIGHGATLKALTSADIHTSGLMLTDLSQVGIGPARITIEGVRFSGNRAARIAAGSIPNAPQQRAMIFCMGTQRVRILNNEFEDLQADAVIMGGNISTGRLSAYFLIEGNTVQDAGRNGISYVGTVYGNTIGNQSFSHSFGVGHGNISYAYDIEPDNANTPNIDLIFTSNQGGGSQVGFGFNNNSWNSFITLSGCRTYANTIGTTPTGFFAAASLSSTVKLTGCADNGSTTAFSGCASAGF